MKENPPRPEYMRLSSLPRELFETQDFNYGDLSEKWFLRIVLKYTAYTAVSVYQNGAVYGKTRLDAKDCPGATDAERYEHALRYVEARILLGEL